MTSSVGLLLAGLLVLAGCGGSDTRPPPSRTEFSNQGKICLFPAGEENGEPTYFSARPRTYGADALVNVAVELASCLSSSCSQDLQASCSVSGTTGALQVTSSGSYVSSIPPSGACTADCRSLVARCQTAALPAGTTTFQHGTTTLSVTLPFTGAPPCAGP